MFFLEVALKAKKVFKHRLERASRQLKSLKNSNGELSGIASNLSKHRQQSGNLLTVRGERGGGGFNLAAKRVMRGQLGFVRSKYVDYKIHSFQACKSTCSKDSSSKVLRKFKRKKLFHVENWL